jgi:hypothetical protein
VRLTSDHFIGGEPQQVLDMQPGEMWLVEAYRYEPDGQWYTSPGQPTKLASQAVPELLVLRAWASGKALPAHFSGETFDRRAVPPYRPGVLVNLRGAQSFSTFSDSQGHFRIDNVPPGVYEASTDPPMEQGTLRIDLTKAWCAERTLLLK